MIEKISRGGDLKRFRAGSSQNKITKFLVGTGGGIIAGMLAIFLLKKALFEEAAYANLEFVYLSVFVLFAGINIAAIASAIICAGRRFFAHWSFFLLSPLCTTTSVIIWFAMPILIDLSGQSLFALPPVINSVIMWFAMAISGTPREQPLRLDKFINNYTFISLIVSAAGSFLYNEILESLLRKRGAD